METVYETVTCLLGRHFEFCNSLRRYQKKCDELEVRNGEYKKKFDQLTQDKEDIVLFIKNKLDEKSVLHSFAVLQFIEAKHIA